MLLDDDAAATAADAAVIHAAATTTTIGAPLCPPASLGPLPHCRRRKKRRGEAGGRARWWRGWRWALEGLVLVQGQQGLAVTHLPIFL